MEPDTINSFDKSNEEKGKEREDTCPINPIVPVSECRDTNDRIIDNGGEFHKPSIQRLTSLSTPLLNDTPTDIKMVGSPELQSLLLHIPEMNLPWHPLRDMSKCSCGVAFSFTERKVI